MIVEIEVTVVETADVATEAVAEVVVAVTSPKEIN
jgi:hypothetical protein